MPRQHRSKVRREALKAGLRSGFEHVVAKQLTENNVEYEYETVTITYDGRPRRYKPDFILSNGIIIEVKGRFLGADRSKHLLIKKQHPDLDIRFLFQVDQTLSKNSDTRYSDWCEKHGFKYAFVDVPKEWMEEADA